MSTHTTKCHAAIALLAALLLAPAARAQCEPEILGTFETEFDHSGIVVSGTLAYVTDGWIEGDPEKEYGEGFLRIFDVSDDNNVVLVGSVEVGFRAGPLAVEGDRAYVGCAWDVGLVVVDVADPANPKIVGSRPKMPVGDIIVRDSTAYVAHRGLHMLDVSDDANPVVVGEVLSEQSTTDLQLVGSVAYLAHYGGFMTIDVTDPADPGVLAEVDHANCRAIAVSSVAIYCCGWKELFMYSASDPANPVFLGSVAMLEPTNLAVSGSVLYLTEWEWLKVFDVSIPAQPSFVGALDVGGTVGARILLDGNRMFAATNRDPIHIVSVASCQPPAFGACCVSGTCYEWMTESNCAALEGVYLGDDSLCGDSPCSNDDCAQAIAIAVGDTAFSTLDATTDGPALPEECDKGAGVAFENDVWFVYLPAASGTLTVSTCDQADFDTRLAAYTGACGGLELVACNDDAPGCASKTSIMEVPVTAGTPVRIRAGGSGPTRGTGTLTLTQSGCASDIDGNGDVDFEDLVRLLSDWGPCGK